MSESTPIPPRNLEQQHKLAKDLLREARAGDAQAMARIRAHRTDAVEPKLADAQLVIARQARFDSWPKLVAQLQATELDAFQFAVRRSDVAATRKVLETSEHVRQHINDPLFDFGGRAINAAAESRPMLELLLEFGADVNLRSAWDAGPFGVLDSCDEPTARFLLARGATLTAHAAARLGWLDELRTIVETNPSVVHERGGDGKQPLHFAETPEIADFLLDHGAQIDTRCIDHHSTPAQYALVERPEVCRRLLERGATADIFMPARLGDIDLARRLINQDPNCVAARVNMAGYKPVPPFNIYCWELGFFTSPHEVALKYDHRDVYDVLIEHSPPRVRVLEAVARGDEAAARKANASLQPQDHALLAHAIFHGNRDAAMLMLKLGFDPRARGTDGGTALHMAAWRGDVEIVEALLSRGVEIDAVDPTHGATPLSWAAYGSVNCRARGADYVGVIDRLVAAGANVQLPGNKHGSSMLQMAGENGAVKAALRRHGAS